MEIPHIVPGALRQQDEESQIHNTIQLWLVVSQQLIEIFRLDESGASVEALKFAINLMLGVIGLNTSADVRLDDVFVGPALMRKLLFSATHQARSYRVKGEKMEVLTAIAKLKAQNCNHTNHFQGLDETINMLC